MSATYAPSKNCVILRYRTAQCLVSMSFETVEEARQYLAYAQPRKIKEEDENARTGLNIPSPRILEDSIVIYENGVEV